ncbi:MAG: IS630 family transposase [Actinomycetota bacterium]|nr:IS630 family transposase [Actinomycetota bacterium]
MPGNGPAIARSLRPCLAAPASRLSGGTFTGDPLVLRLVTIDRKRPVDVELGRIPDLEVWMRPPSVFVRELLPEEGNRLKRLSRKAASEAKRERALIVWASATRMPVSQIATLVGTDESHVRKVIHAFNERGFGSLDPEQRGGRPRRITDEQRARIVAVAGARPDTLGVPATRWSLKRLARYLAEQQIVDVSPAHLGRILDMAGLSFQRTRTWKASPDPDYETKAAKVIALYKHCPEGGVVISFDQMGPISLRPHAGSGWAKRKRPERQRATYSKLQGTRYVFGAYDVHGDRLRTRLRPRRRGRDNLAFMRQIRACYPKRLRIYWIQDNLSANWTPDIQAFAQTNNIELVPTPTYASYLNRVECHFLPISEFVVKNSDYLNWDAFNYALARHITDRNGAHRDQRILDLERRRQIAA